MRFRNFFLRVGLSVLLIGCATGATNKAFATTPPVLVPPAGLGITKIKMTGDEFITLQNNSSTTISDLSKYWLYAFSKTNPLAVGATSSAQQLPAAALPVGASLLLSGGGSTCGATVTTKLSLSLGDSTGALQLLGSTPEGLIVPTPIDAVSWSSGADGDIANVPKSTVDKQAAYYRIQASAGSHSWQLADVAVDAATGVANLCQLNVGTAGPVQPVSDGGLMPSVEPTAVIIGLADSSVAPSAGAVLPVADVGLAAPQLTEVLPNPVGTGTDASDEFIELYNGNATTFDLSGFTLQTGTAIKHSYVFPAGTMLPAKGFVAFYSAKTGLTLSNSGGQTDLLDPFGTSLSHTDTYGTAKDGQAWALANGVWRWTIEATPGATNVIKQPSSTSAVNKTSGRTSKSTTGVKGAATTSSMNTGSAVATTPSTTTAPIHPLVLAAVAVLAVGYGIYEYRHDLANRIHQFRANRAARRSPRPQPARR